MVITYVKAVMDVVNAYGLQVWEKGIDSGLWEASLVVDGRTICSIDENTLIFEVS